MQQYERHMAEETKFKIWQVVQSVIGTLLVFSIITLSSTLGELNDNVLKHEILIEQLEKFKESTSKNRYTDKEGKAETDARIQADAQTVAELRSLNANQVRMWKAIRDHISAGPHQEAEYRLKQLEKHIEHK